MDFSNTFDEISYDNQHFITAVTKFCYKIALSFSPPPANGYVNYLKK